MSFGGVSIETLPHSKPLILLSFYYSIYSFGRVGRVKVISINRNIYIKTYRGC